MALRPVFPADFLPADFVAGAIFYKDAMLANVLVSRSLSQQLRYAIEENNLAIHGIGNAIRTDRGSRCWVSRR